MPKALIPPSPTVDAIMATERAKSFTTRSIKKESKEQALKLALSMVDLTTLEGKDSPEKVRSLCRKAVRPWERDEEVLGQRLPRSLPSGRTPVFRARQAEPQQRDQLPVAALEPRPRRARVCGLVAHGSA